MNLRDLQYLVAIADHKHFGLAAKTCFVSQPTLSGQIKRLEETLGVLLIERAHKKVWLTPIGEKITEQARDVLQKVKEIQETSKLARDPYVGKIKLGTIPTLAPYLLPQVIPEFNKQLPGLDIYLVEEKTAVLLEQLEKGYLDVALIAMPVKTHKLAYQILFSEPFYLACAAENPLSKKQSVTLEEIKDQNLMLLADGHCMRDHILEACHFENKTFSDFSATSLETLCLMVAANMGLTLLPALAIDAYARYPNLHCIPFATPGPFRQIALCWREKSSRKLCWEKMGAITSAVVEEIL